MLGTLGAKIGFPNSTEPGNLNREFQPLPLSIQALHPLQARGMGSKHCSPKGFHASGWLSVLGILHHALAYFRFFPSLPWIWMSAGEVLLMTLPVPCTQRPPSLTPVSPPPVPVPIPSLLLFLWDSLSGERPLVMRCSELTMGFTMGC